MRERAAVSPWVGATWLAFVVAWLSIVGPGECMAQPPGTPPPEKVFDESDAAESLSIDAFLFLSESENQVIVPNMTWEKLQKLIDLDRGADVQQNTYSYRSLEITGTTDRQRAELEVVVEISLESTDDRWVSVPLNMGNFHQLAPPDVSGIDRYDTRLLPEGKGYQLLVNTDKQTEVTLRMMVSALVQTGSRSRSLDFQLPDVPSKVRITTDTTSAAGEVMGRGDETVIATTGQDDRTEFAVESSGGNFSLRWSQVTKTSEDPLLEVESRMTVRWMSLQSPVLTSVRTSIGSLRGAIDRFQLWIPDGATLREPPQLGSNGQSLDLGPPNTQKRGTVYEITVPDQERRSRIDITFDIQFEPPKASSREPFQFRMPEIRGALRHHGVLEIRTSGDFRLRWRAQPWVRTMAEAETIGTENEPIYSFRFDRVSADFPIWLGRKESQLRMTSQSTITIRGAVASLDMIIRPTGQVSEGNLYLEESSWQLHSIENLDSGRPLDSFLSDFVRVIELENDADSDPTPIRIRAEFPLDEDADRIELPLPRVVDLGDAALVQNATVDIVNSGRTVFVVDLAATKDLRRRSLATADSDQNQLVRQFEVSNVESSVVIVGDLVEQPPQITFASTAKVDLDGNQLRTKVQWTISSRTDLEGRLPIRIPRSHSVDVEGRESRASDPDSSEDTSDLSPGDPQRNPGTDPSIDQGTSWVVTVDDVPASLRSLGDDRFELVSDMLISGTMQIKWQQVRQRSPDDPTEEMMCSVALPRPNVADVMIDSAMTVDLEGDQTFDLISVDSRGTNTFRLDALPRDPILLRIKPRQSIRDELVINKSLLTTLVGTQTRHEQLLVETRGGEQLNIGLPKAWHSSDDESGLSMDITVEGFVDRQSVGVRRDQKSLIVPLPGDRESHVVDVRIWYTRPTPSSWATVQPSLQLPIGSGRSYWQIIAPSNGHIIWTTPTLGRAMTWQFDRWKLYRTPTHSQAQLAQLIPSRENLLPTGNRYLYVGSDLASFQVLVVSRTAIWLVVGSVVLLLTALLTQFAWIRHPLAVVFAAVLFAGLLVIAPDAAVLAGQLGILSLVLLIVMIAIRSMVRPGSSDRIFMEARDISDQPPESSGVDRRSSGSGSGTSIPSTQLISPATTSEASS